MASVQQLQRARAWAATLRFIAVRFVLRGPRAVVRAAGEARRCKRDPYFSAAFYNFDRRRPSPVSPYWHYALAGKSEGALYAPVPGRDLRPAEPGGAAALLGVCASPAGGGGPLVSVIMATRNRSHTILGAVRSVLDQSEGDVELLVCDDGSQDGTVAQLRRAFPAAVGAGRLRLLEKEPAKRGEGAGATRNRGLAEACGSYVAYLDSDNLWHGSHLAEHLKALRETGALVSVSASRQAGVPIAANAGRAAQLQFNALDISGLVHRRELIDRLGGLDSRLRRFEDYDFILRLTRTARPALLSQPSYEYLLQSDSVSLRRPLLPYREWIHRNHALERVIMRLTPGRIQVTDAALAASGGALRPLQGWSSEGGSGPPWIIVLAAVGESLAPVEGRAALYRVGGSPAKTEPAMAGVVAVGEAVAGMAVPRLLLQEVTYLAALAAEAKA